MPRGILKRPAFIFGMMMKKKTNIIIDCLQTVYDPEFPMIDLYTLGLIYDVKIDETNNMINLLMTYTTPSCPM
jgi:metal-sulfur cluster biosynthetic enzyme